MREPNEMDSILHMTVHLGYSKCALALIERK